MLFAATVSATLLAAGFLSGSAAAAGALRPTPLAALAAPPVEPVQFRFPWEQRQKAKPRRRAAKPQKSRRQAPAAARREPSRKGSPPPPAAPVAAQPDPLDAALPPAAAPAGIAAPRGTTEREADGWARLAAEIPAPADAPRIADDGPGPAPASVIALLAATRVGDQTTAPARLARAESFDEAEDETPDRHVPLPPVRPASPSERASAPRDGLAPEGQGLAPEGGGLAPEGRVPLPPERPGGGQASLEPEAPKPPPGPSAPAIALPVVAHDDDADCRALASEGVAEAERLPPIEGPGVCGGGPLVSLTSVKRRDGTPIKIHPAATLRCSMARELTAYLRDDVAPAAEASGLGLARLEIAGSFQCRGRNGATAGKMSEHGRANAVDLSGFGFADGKEIGVFAPELPKPMADRLKAGACERFSTVLGPGSDGFHEDHLHVDLQPRRTKSKLCQWDEPDVAKANGGTDEDAAKAEDGAPDAKTAARRKPADEDGPKRSQTP
ncbi:extensin family protein [Methylopila sp. M107]|uniref:extensin-like domain-containing protein n=1 Tax=Methylopila sp. M107 TaxID=1101190 RepID=UPI00039FBD49|nr:extensin family protein [Methylopila sp. M107]